MPQLAKYVGGASVGTCTIHSTVYMDDCNRYATETNDVDAAHTNFMLFSARKRSEVNHDKCVLLPVNLKPSVHPPTLMIGDHKMKVVEEAKILGDHINSKGNNSTLIEARVNSSKAVTTNMLAMCNEATFGFYRIKVLMLLYRMVFVPTMLFNSEAWSHLTTNNISKLKTAQLRSLKRIMKTASSTPNAFVFLELGVMPVDFEIQRRQLGFLHHILVLGEDDPVKEMYEQLKCYPDAENWVTTIHKILKKYDLPVNEKEIEVISKTTWKEKVKKAVLKVAWETLTAECKSKKKTCNLEFTDTLIEPQTYLEGYASDVAIIIFKLRGKSVNCMHNRGSDALCRLCGAAKETQEHAINCPKIAKGGLFLTLNDIYGIVPTNNTKVRQIVERFNAFEEAVLEESETDELMNSEQCA